MPRLSSCFLLTLSALVAHWQCSHPTPAHVAACPPSPAGPRLRAVGVGEGEAPEEGGPTTIFTLYGKQSDGTMMLADFGAKTRAQGDGFFDDRSKKGWQVRGAAAVRAQWRHSSCTVACHQG
jgi:hypothetical protein